MIKKAIFILFVMFILISTQIYIHEAVHYEIGRHHGCEEGKIELHIIESSFYQCLDPTHKTSDQEKQLHLMNEIFTYNTIIPINIILFYIIINLITIQRKI